MPRKTFDILLRFALFFMAYWFFGNLYEEIAMVPNHLANTYETLTGYVNYFHLTSPVFYFVPFTQLAVVVLVILYIKCDDIKQKQLLKKASAYGIAALVLTAIIVTQINVKIFSPNFHQYHDQLYGLSLWWLVGNGVRILLVGNAVYCMLQTFVLRSKTSYD